MLIPTAAGLIKSAQGELDVFAFSQIVKLLDHVFKTIFWHTYHPSIVGLLYCLGDHGSTVKQGVRGKDEAVASVPEVLSRSLYKRGAR